MLGEYLERQTLAKLGFTSPVGELEADKAAAFVLISNEIEKLLNEEHSKASRK